MSIDFHESQPNIEGFDELPLKIIEPAEGKGWGIAFDTDNQEKLEAYDRAIDGILKIEMVSHRLDAERSSATHHEWEIEDSSLLGIESEEAKEYVGGMIDRIQHLAQKSGGLERAA
jgi:hypothetical protein